MANGKVDAKIDEKEPENTELTGFVPVQLRDIMDPSKIIYSAQVTENVKELKREMEEKRKKSQRKGKLAKQCQGYIIENVHMEWDVDKDNNKEQIVALLNRDWSKWTETCDTAQRSYVIGRITDPTNPTMELRASSSASVYGLFAIEPIAKHTVLFEYAGIVQRKAEAFAELDHIEKEIWTLSVLELDGHVNEDRSQNIWGQTADDVMTINPAEFHNEFEFFFLNNK
ncbi:hypothetical protein RFI_23021 [Reticulomyxa filosa]|uniref:Uncharacterized protein n=1 Tax=Reticulomyxa filosa TaxID=46433 RepID=X6MLM3_RETFI|nr:hypothetical protein RFI_23021 [Reticulomyxa filosa]|eukprot:ETO14347.1 hypothetical protein RFI_23021 [Reticulomyxa filosa]